MRVRLQLEVFFAQLAEVRGEGGRGRGPLGEGLREEGVVVSACWVAGGLLLLGGRRGLVLVLAG